MTAARKSKSLAIVHQPGAQFYRQFVEGVERAHPNSAVKGGAGGERRAGPALLGNWTRDSCQSETARLGRERYSAYWRRPKPPSHPTAREIPEHARRGLMTSQSHLAKHKSWPYWKLNSDEYFRPLIRMQFSHESHNGCFQPRRALGQSCHESAVARTPPRSFD